MNNVEKESKKTGNKMGRMIVILSIFAILAACVWALPLYLESTMPKGNDEYARVRADGSEAEEEERQSGMEVIAEYFNGPGPSKEETELKEKKAEEVVFTYDAIAKMSPSELTKNIKEVTERLQKMRSSLPPSISGASMGGGSEKPNADDEVETVSVPYLALPLEVMKQMAEK